MIMKLTYRTCFFCGLLLLSIIGFAQPNSHWDQEKIMGKRYLLPDHYAGSPYYIQDWVVGTVTFKSGEQVHDLKMKYDGQLDELVYISDLFHSAITIDKETIESFEFEYQGRKYLFEQRFFDGFFAGNHFFQVYHKGATDLLCFRKIELNTTTAYKDASGILKNMEYQKGYRFFLFQEGKGFYSTRLKRKSLMKYFSKEERRQVTRLLRDQHIQWGSPEEFAHALSVLEENKLEIDL